MQMESSKGLPDYTQEINIAYEQNVNSMKAISSHGFRGNPTWFQTDVHKVI